MDLDVAVIGASTAGLYAAELLARAGRRVAVFERRIELIPARRTYIITPRLIQFFDDLPEEIILHRIHSMAIFAQDLCLEIALGESDLVVERSQLTQYLAGRAKDAGVDIYLGWRFLGFLSVNGRTGLRMQVQGKGEKIATAKAVIGADGVCSAVGRAAGIQPPTTVPVIQTEVELPACWNPEVAQVWFDVLETRFFYWMIPKSVLHGVVGLIGEEESDPRNILSRFLARHNLRPLVSQSGSVAMHHPGLRPWGKVGSAPLVLVGDAAGQVKVTTVGGTVTGLWGAQAAVRALVAGKPYAHELRHLKRELDLHWWIRTLLERLDNPGYGHLLGCVGSAVRGFLRYRNRDQMAGAIWRLPLLEPRLTVLGLRLLLKGGVFSSRRRMQSGA